MDPQNKTIQPLGWVKQYFMVKITQPIPPAKGNYLSRRAIERNAIEKDLRELQAWFKTNPDVHEDQWWKNFNSFMLTGTGPLLDTILAKGMAVIGREVK